MSLLLSVRVLPEGRPRREGRSRSSTLSVPSAFDSVAMADKKPAKNNSALMTPMQPSPELAKIVGHDPLPRSEMTKKLWSYIKANNLQNPANKRNVLCDDQLKAIMGKDEVTMFEMTRLVNKHLSAV